MLVMNVGSCETLTLPNSLFFISLFASMLSIERRDNRYARCVRKFLCYTDDSLVLSLALCSGIARSSLPFMRIHMTWRKSFPSRKFVVSTLQLCQLINSKILLHLTSLAFLSKGRKLPKAIYKQCAGCPVETVRMHAL